MRIVILATAAVILAHGQAFDVATIKPSGPDSHRSFDFTPGQLVANRITLRSLIRAAYRVQDFQVSGGPRWLDTDYYDIVAKTSGPASNTQLPLMLQSLLVNRFRLAVHREKGEGPGYVITVGKSGIKFLEASATATGNEGDFRAGPGAVAGTTRISGSHANITQLAAALASLLLRPVMDETGLKGTYDLKLEWTPDNPMVRADTSDLLGPSLQGAMQEQLGLHLESRKVPMEMLVIESAEKPSAN